MLCAQATDVFGRLNGEKMEGSDDTEQNNKIFFLKKSEIFPAEQQKNCELLQEKVCTNERLH